MKPSAELSHHQPPTNLYDWHRHHYTCFLNLTATKIQSFWRGRELRLRLAHVLWRHWLADKIQKCWRKHKCRQSFRSATQQTPATKIQSFLRGSLLRHCLARILINFGGCVGSKQDLLTQMRRDNYTITMIDKTLDAMQLWIEEHYKIFNATPLTD